MVKITSEFMSEAARFVYDELKLCEDVVKVDLIDEDAFPLTIHFTTSSSKDDVFAVEMHFDSDGISLSWYELRDSILDLDNDDYGDAVEYYFDMVECITTATIYDRESLAYTVSMKLIDALCKHFIGNTVLDENDLSDIIKKYGKEDDCDDKHNHINILDQLVTCPDIGFTSTTIHVLHRYKINTIRELLDSMSSYNEKGKCLLMNHTEISWDVYRDIQGTLQCYGIPLPIDHRNIMSEARMRQFMDFYDMKINHLIFMKEKLSREYKEAKSKMDNIRYLLNMKNDNE